MHLRKEGEETRPGWNVCFVRWSVALTYRAGNRVRGVRVRPLLWPWVLWRDSVVSYERLPEETLEPKEEKLPRMGPYWTKGPQWHPTSRMIETAIAERIAARKKNDYRRADQIRAQLARYGIVLEDNPAGTDWRVEQ